MFVWDDAKDTSNNAKHGIGFVAARNFDWETSIRIDRSRYDRDGEQRYAQISFLHGKLHTIIYIYRDGILRIVSLRRANKKEEKTYAEKS